MDADRFFEVKVFVIGLNKTGTTSLHTAFGLLGMRSLHWAPEGDDVYQRSIDARRIQLEMRDLIESGDPNPLGSWANYDAYGDIFPINEHFERFYHCYSGSKFIYSERDDESWLRSREKHVHRNLDGKAKGTYGGNYLSVDKDKWLRQKHDHAERVKDFFAANRRSSLLFFNVFAGDNFDKLCGFLNVEKPNQPFPWKNRATRQTNI